MSDYTDQAEAVVETLSDVGADVDQSDVETRFEELVGEYSVPEAEARRSILRHYADEHGVEVDELSSGGGGGGSSETNVEDITSPDQWVTVNVTVVQLWSSDSDAVKQTGLVADETGRIKFTAWSESDLELLEDGASYRLENVVTDEYQGRMSIQLNSSTEITELDEEIDAEENAVEFEGAMVDIQSGSGLIKRCPEDNCTRVLNDGRCSEHGSQEGEFDLRIKAVLDDGLEVQQALFDREATEELTGTTLEEAKDAAKEALDTGVVEQNFQEQLVGTYYRVEGPIVGRNLLVSDTLEPSEANPEDVLVRARGEVDA